MIFWASIGNFVEGEKSKSLVSSCIRVEWPISILFRWWNFPKTSTLLVSGFQISVRSNTSSSVGSQLGWHWKTFLRKPENFSSPMCQYWWWRFTALEKQSEQIGKNWRKSWGRWKKLGGGGNLGVGSRQMRVVAAADPTQHPSIRISSQSVLSQDSWPLSRALCRLGGNK